MDDLLEEDAGGTEDKLKWKREAVEKGSLALATHARMDTLVLAYRYPWHQTAGIAHSFVSVDHGSYESAVPKFG
jgi:hypothetical protein